jgi:transcription elongation factor Elf1
MGRKRQRVVKIIKRKLPSQYLCPNCGKNTISIILRKDENLGRIICASCNLKSQFPVPSNIEPVDAYCLFVDNYYGTE